MQTFQVRASHLFSTSPRHLGEQIFKALGGGLSTPLGVKCSIGPRTGWLELVIVPTSPCIDTDFSLNEQLVISIPAIKPITMMSLIDTCMGAVTRSGGHLSASYSTKSKRTESPHGRSVALQNETQAASPTFRSEEPGFGIAEAAVWLLLFRANRKRGRRFTEVSCVEEGHNSSSSACPSSSSSSGSTVPVPSQGSSDFPTAYDLICGDSSGHRPASKLICGME